MSPLRFLTIVCISALVASIAVAVVAQETDELFGPDAPEIGGIVDPFFQYGTINTAHTATLLNHNADKSIHYHYAINNLPSKQDETLFTFASLFTRNPSAPVDAVDSLTIHVCTPTDPSDVLAQTRPLTFKQSVTVENIKSAEEFSLQAYNIQLNKGDILVLSVPNDSIFLHLGPNNVGETVQYGIVSLPSQASSSVSAQYVLSDNNGLPSGSYNQLCATYGTIGHRTVEKIDSNLYVFSSETFIRADGEIYSFQMALAKKSGNDLIDLPSNKHARVEIVIARYQTYTNGRYSVSGYFIEKDLTRTFDQVKHLQIKTINSPIRVQKNDLIGFHVKTDGVYGGWYNPRRDDRRTVFAAGTTRKENTLDESRRGGRESEFTEDEVGIYAITSDIVNNRRELPIVLPRFIQDRVPRFIFNVAEDPEINPPNNAPTGGDPQIGGFQGQSYQFHGLADEIFNLISTPTMQLNSHFVYLSSGKCDYNNTVCFQHPGTYLDVLGFTIPSQQGNVHVKFVAGSHENGLRVWMGHGDAEMTEIEVGKYKHGLKWVMGNDTTQIASVKYNTFGEAEIKTPLIHIKVINSDYFFNLEVALLDRELLRIGSTKHTITDHNICHHDKHGNAQINEAGENLHAEHDHGVVEAQLMKKYHTDYPIHGLIGQTWRNVLVCGKHWMGGVNDYVVSSLFGSDYYYNFHKSH